MTEGAVTEPQYFELLRRDELIKSTVDLDVVPKAKSSTARRGKWDSNPVHVVEKCIELKKSQTASRKKNDEDVDYLACFAIVDVDDWDRTGTKKVIQGFL